MLVVCDLVRFARVLSAAQGTQVQSPPVPGGCWSRDSGESVYAWINCSVDDLTRRAGGQAAPECLGGNTMEAIRDAARITVWRIKKPDERCGRSVSLQPTEVQVLLPKDLQGACITVWKKPARIVDEQAAFAQVL